MIAVKVLQTVSEENGDSSLRLAFIFSHPELLWRKQMDGERRRRMETKKSEGRGCNVMHVSSIIHQTRISSSICLLPPVSILPSVHSRPNHDDDTCGTAETILRFIVISGRKR